MEYLTNGMTNGIPLAGWPLNKAEVPMSPFVTGSEVRGHNGWGPVLRRYFISSKAAAIIVDDAVPLWVSVNSNQSQKLCLQARGNEYPYYNMEEDMFSGKRNLSQSSSKSHSLLNYTICTSTDIETLENALADTTTWDGLRKDEMEVTDIFNQIPGKIDKFGFCVRSYVN